MLAESAYKILYQFLKISFFLENFVEITYEERKLLVGQVTKLAQD